MSELLESLTQNDKKLLDKITKESAPEGWGIYLASGGFMGEDEWRIERHDDMSIFKDDAEAMKFVVSKAINERTKLHTDTIKFISKYGSIQELKAILKSITL